MKFNNDMSICPYIKKWKGGPSRCCYVITTHPPPPALAIKVIAHLLIAHLCWGGEGFLRRSNKRRLYLKFGQFFLTDRPTDIHTDRQTNRQTLWFLGKLHFQKIGIRLFRFRATIKSKGL